MPEVRSQFDDPAWTLWRVHVVQWISGLQICEAEFHRREMPAMQRRRPGREEGAQGQYVLWLQQLSEMQIHFGRQADCREVPDVRQRISGGKIFEVGAGDCVSQQGMRLRAAE